MEREVLPYSRPQSERVSWWVWPLTLGAVGVIFTVPATLLALISAGAGHGHYVAARLLFPLPLLLTRLTNNSITGCIFVLVISQFPVYGVVTGLGRGRWMLMPALLLLIIHAIAAGICFSGVLSNFY